MFLIGEYILYFIAIVFFIFAFIRHNGDALKSIIILFILTLAFLCDELHNGYTKRDLSYFMKYEYDATNKAQSLCLEKFKDERIKNNITFKEFDFNKCYTLESEGELLN